MKTPREILLNQHHSAESELDHLWTMKLSLQLPSKAAVLHRNVLLALIRTLWCELILPSRRIWASLACVWLLIAVLNLAFSEPSIKVASKVESPSREETEALVEQRQMLAQLIGPLAEPAYTQKRAAPGPRSERSAQTSAA